MDKLEKTERGFFGFGRFKTKWHGQMRVQESSAAFHGPVAWVFTELDYSNNPKEHPPALHLKYDDAKNLRDALTKFIEQADARKCCETHEDDADHYDECKGCCPDCGEHCPEEGGTSCGASPKRDVGDTV
jgi:hypothetical protein